MSSSAYKYLASFARLGILFWLTLMVLNTSKVIEIGKSFISFDWVVYSITMYVCLLVIDYLTEFKNKGIKLAYVLFLLDLIVFNLAIMNNWYEESPLVNRAEHFAGSFIVCLIVYSLLRYFKGLKQNGFYTKLYVAIATANMLTVVNELIELGMDYFFDSKSIGPQIWDTNLDLFANTLAFVAFSIMMIAYRRYRAD